MAGGGLLQTNSPHTRPNMVFERDALKSGAFLNFTLGADGTVFSEYLVMMRHADFHVGKEFFTATGRWRCTDVGNRVIVAISLEPREMVRSSRDEVGTRREERFISNDPRDLAGPPYGVVEHVFDESSFDGCHESAD